MLAMRDNGRRARLARRLSAPLATMWWWLSLQCMRTQAPPRQRATTVSGSSGLPDFEVGLQPSQPWLKISRVGVSDLCRLHSIALDYIRLQRRHQNPKIMCRARVKASTTRRVTDKGDGTATLRLRALVLRPRSLRSPADQAPPHKTRPRAATGAQSARSALRVVLFCWPWVACVRRRPRGAPAALARVPQSPPRGTRIAIIADMRPRRARAPLNRWCASTAWAHRCPSVRSARGWTAKSWMGWLRRATSTSSLGSTRARRAATRTSRLRTGACRRYWRNATWRPHGTARGAVDLVGSLVQVLSGGGRCW